MASQAKHVINNQRGIPSVESKLTLDYTPEIPLPVSTVPVGTKEHNILCPPARPKGHLANSGYHIRFKPQRLSTSVLSQLWLSSRLSSLKSTLTRALSP